MEEVKSVRFLAKEVGADGVEFVLGNGQRLAVKLAELPAGMVTRLALHGLSQKIGDATASCSKDSAFGAAFAAMSTVRDALIVGNWGVEREASGNNDLIDAITAVKKMDREGVAAAVYAASVEQRKAWAKNAKVAAVMLDLKAKRAKAVAKEEGEEFDFEV